MQRLKSTLAWRLTLWFLLLSFLPIGTMALFVRHTVADAFTNLAQQETRSRARVLAAEVASLARDVPMAPLLEANVDRDHSAFILSHDGRYLERPAADRGGPAMALSDNTLKRIATEGEGTTIDAPSRRLVGFATIPGRQAIVVVVMDGSLVATAISRMETASVVQLAVILLIVSLLGGLAIWVVIGPIQRLTKAAEEVGAGNLGIEVDRGQMEGELEVLADAFNKMTRRLRESYDEMERRVADRTRDLAALNTISAVVARSLDLEEILGSALDKTMQLVGLESGAAFRLTADGKALELLVHRGLPDDFADRLARMPSATTPNPALLARGHAIAFTPSECPEAALKDALERQGLNLAVAIPLIAKGQVVGTLNLGSQRARALSAEELSLLDAIGRQVGMAVENARLYENAEESAVAAERNRLARDLHDAVTQILFSASLIAEVLPRLWQRDPAEGQRRLEELRELTRGALAEMRMLLLELRPAALTESSLDSLLRHLAEATTGRARLPIALEVATECHLPPDVQVAMYRIAQEALNNVAKHAAASAAAIELRLGEGQVELVVRDDGRGFDAARTAADHLGLGIIRERATAIGAAVSITSEAGQGTSVSARWPAKRPGAGAAG